MEELAELLQSAADPTRLRLLRLLHEARTEVCGCELADSLVLPQYNLSKHLKLLRAAGLIASRKEGQWVYYRLRSQPDEARASLLRLVAAAPDRTLTSDRRNFAKRLRLRTDGKCLIGIRNPTLLRKAGRGGG